MGWFVVWPAGRSRGGADCASFGAEGEKAATSNYQLLNSTERSEVLLEMPRTPWTVCPPKRDENPSCVVQL